MLTALLLLQAVPAGQQPQAADVVVTARPLAQTEKALSDCVARNCPPDQEAAAALAHAEGQFLAGSYPGAMSTLRQTLNRVDGAARSHPVPVGNLWLAYGRIAQHRGLNDLARGAMLESLDALRAGLPRTDKIVLAQRIEVAEAAALAGRAQSALSLYHDVAADAERLGLHRIQGDAIFREALLQAVLDERTGDGRRTRARNVLDRLARTKAPELAPYRNAGEQLFLAMDAQAGDEKALEQLIARAGPAGGATPQLIYAPPVTDPLQQARDARGLLGATPLPSPNFRDQWVDVGYLIGTDGRVVDARVLRQSAHRRGDWSERVLDAVRRRRFTPLASEAAGPGLYRVERLTLTSPLQVAETGTRLQERTGAWQVVSIDLTDEKAASRPR